MTDTIRVVIPLTCGAPPDWQPAVRLRVDEYKARKLDAAWRAEHGLGRFNDGQARGERDGGNEDDRDAAARSRRSDLLTRPSLTPIAAASPSLLPSVEPSPAGGDEARNEPAPVDGARPAPPGGDGVIGGAASCGNASVATPERQVAAVHSRTGLDRALPRMAAPPVGEASTRDGGKGVAQGAARHPSRVDPARALPPSWPPSRVEPSPPWGFLLAAIVTVGLWWLILKHPIAMAVGLSCACAVVALLAACDRMVAR